MEKPFVWDPLLEVLAERGVAHERSYLDHLEASGLHIVRIGGIGADSAAVAQTLDAMRSGAPVIAQGALKTGRWGGRLDVLRRVDKSSSFGAWSCEVIDTKLARETKGNTVLQICLYSDLLTDAQNLAPEFAYVVTPGSGFKPQAYRYLDYAAYYRRVRNSLERAIQSGGGELYPEPRPHCEICRWRRHCDAKWRADDHLSATRSMPRALP